MAKLTPFNYAQLYWSLPVAVVNEAGELTGWDFARVDRYRLANKISADGTPEAYDAVTTNGLSDFSKIKPFADKKTQEIKIYIKNPDGTIRTETFKRADENRLMRFAKKAVWGKGSPEECQITLQLALRYGLAVNINELRKYCEDGKIGLDCNGFVGSYMRDVLGKNVDHNTTIDVLLKSGHPVTKIEEINNQNIYVLGLVSNSGVVIPRKLEGKIGHVMITTPMGFDMIGILKSIIYPRVRVVESTGGKGLVESDYLLLGTEKKNGKETGVFKVHRGSKNEEMRVRISRVYI